MYVRLAFAIAAHLEPDILVLDEVLAVGDARFQKKCLGKVRDVSALQGRTVIFVSHDLQAVQRLCTRCMLLEQGRLAEFGPTRAVVARYAGAVGVVQPTQWLDLTPVPRDGTGAVRFTAMRLTSLNPEVGNRPFADGPLEIELTVEARAPAQVQSIAVGIRDDLGRRLVNADVGSFGETFSLPAGRSFVRLRIERLHLKAGSYSVALWAARYAGEAISSGDIFDHVARACEIEVVGHATRTSLGRIGPVTCDFRLLGVSPEPFHDAPPTAATARDPASPP
jgi:lipopolysaccharide transport system ATP-binding protein